MERAGALPGLERHPEQPAAALARGRRPRQRVPHAVEQQQRQHLRFPGPAALLRAPDAPRRALRARRLDHRHRRRVQRQAAQLAERRRAASGRQLLVHRSAVRRPALRGHGRRGGRTGQHRRAGSIRSSGQPPEHRQLQARAADRRVPRRHRAARSTWWSARTRCPIPNGLCFSPDYKKLYVVSTGKGPGDTGPGGKGDMYVFDVGADNKLSNGKLFSDFMVDGVKCGPDGVRADVDGNLWCSSNAGPRRRLQRRHGVDAAGQADRPHPPARSLRQRLLRRARSATACSWPRASRCMPSIRRPRALLRRR